MFFYYITNSDRDIYCLKLDNSAVVYGSEFKISETEYSMPKIKVYGFKDDSYGVFWVNRIPGIRLIINIKIFRERNINNFSI